MFAIGLYEEVSACLNIKLLISDRKMIYRKATKAKTCCPAVSYTLVSWCSVLEHNRQLCTVEVSIEEIGIALCSQGLRVAWPRTSTTLGCSYSLPMSNRRFRISESSLKKQCSYCSRSRVPDS